MKIRWSVLQRYLCDERLREQLMKAAERAVEICHMWNMMHPDRKKDCSRIAAAKWLR